MPATRTLPFSGLAGYVTVAEAAHLLGITPRAVRYRITAHRLPVLKLGGAFLVRLADLRTTGRGA